MSKKKDDGYFAADGGRKRKTIIMIVAVVIAAIAAGIAITLSYKPAPAAAIGGVECNRGEMLQYHFHSHLSVFVNGQEQLVPGSIGIVSTPLILAFTGYTLIQQMA